MTQAESDEPLEIVRRVVGRYAVALRRQVADRLLKSRGKQTNDELIEKLVAATANVPVIDRRLRDLTGEARSLLGLIHLSRRSRWRLGGLLELLSGLRAESGMSVVFDLLEAGLLFPELPASGPVLTSFEDWLSAGASVGYRIYAPPKIAERAAATALALEPLTETVKSAREPREADGLELVLRLGVLWQIVKAGPLRLTQQGEFFKKDHERLTTDPLVVGNAADELLTLKHPGHLTVALGLALGLLAHDAGELRAAEAPTVLLHDLPTVVEALWSGLAELDAWTPTQGWRGLSAAPAPYGSAGVLALALLAQLPNDTWTTPAAVASWLAQRHCYWTHPIEEGEEDEAPEALRTPPPTLSQWAEPFLLGVAFQLRLVQAAKDADDRTVVRLSPFGRGVLGCGPTVDMAQFPKTLLIQPNLELVAYRQGLTPELIANLSRFCTWKYVGPACTLQLQPESVYRGLETGLSYEQILQTLQQHAVRDLPPTVLQALKTWADKRERVTVWSSATLLEFGSAQELEEALGRGLPATRLSDRLALVAQESDIDYRHFRLTGTRDYGLPPDRCVEVAEDGVTLSIDVVRSDLLLETEVQRFADPQLSVEANGRRIYRLTPNSLKRGRDGGVSARSLEDWFQQRTGTQLPPAVRMLLDASTLPPTVVQRLLVVQAPTILLADGLMQWPATRRLIQTRLGPTALVIEEPHLPALRRLLEELQVPLKMEEPPGASG